MEDLKLSASFPLSMESNHPRTTSFDMYQQVLNFDSITGPPSLNSITKNFCDYCYTPSTSDMKHFPACSHYICSSCISASSYHGFRNITCPLCPQELTNKPLVNSISNPAQKSMGYIPMHVFPPTQPNLTIDAFSALLGNSTSSALNGHNLGIANSFSGYPPPSTPPLTSSFINSIPNNINTVSHSGSILSLSLQNSTSLVSNTSPSIGMGIGSLPTNSLTSIVQGTMNGIPQTNITPISTASIVPYSAIIKDKKSPDPQVMCSCDEGVSPATAQCLDCSDYLCEVCVSAHRKVR